MAVAYAFEARAILIAENEIDKRRIRQLHIQSRSHELDVMCRRTKLQQVDESIDQAVAAALQNIYASFPPELEGVENVEQPSEPYVLRMPGKNPDFTLQLNLD
jgi:hypothetical protein